MDKQELIALAQRVEKLEGPCRETDLAIMCALDLRPDWLAKSIGHLWICHRGIHPVVRWCDARMDESCGNPSVDDGPKFTASIDAAMTLAPDHCWVRMDEWPGGFGQARGTASVHPIRDPAVDGHCAKADTLPLALCAASLRARASITRTTGDGDGNG